MAPSQGGGASNPYDNPCGNCKHHVTADRQGRKRCCTASPLCYNNPAVINDPERRQRIPLFPSLAALTTYIRGQVAGVGGTAAPTSSKPYPLPGHQASKQSSSQQATYPKKPPPRGTNESQAAFQARLDRYANQLQIMLGQNTQNLLLGRNYTVSGIPDLTPGAQTQALRTPSPNLTTMLQGDLTSLRRQGGVSQGNQDGSSSDGSSSGYTSGDQGGGAGPTLAPGKKRHGKGGASGHNDKRQAQ